MKGEVDEGEGGLGKGGWRGRWMKGKVNAWEGKERAR